MRRTITDVTVDNDHRRALGRRELFQGTCNEFRVIGVGDSCYFPSVSQETRCNIFGEGNVCVPFDGDPVAVIDPAKIWELEVAGDGGSLAGNPFHHVAIAAQSVEIEIEKLETRAIERFCQPAACDRHTNAGRNSLAQWP